MVRRVVLAILERFIQQEGDQVAAGTGQLVEIGLDRREIVVVFCGLEFGPGIANLYARDPGAQDLGDSAPFVPAVHGDIMARVILSSIRRGSVRGRKHRQQGDYDRSAADIHEETTNHLLSRSGLTPERLRGGPTTVAEPDHTTPAGTCANSQIRYVILIRFALG